MECKCCGKDREELVEINNILKGLFDTNEICEECANAAERHAPGLGRNNWFKAKVALLKINRNSEIVKNSDQISIKFAKKYIKPIVFFYLKLKNGTL